MLFIFNIRMLLNMVTGYNLHHCILTFGKMEGITLPVSCVSKHWNFTVELQTCVITYVLANNSSCFYVPEFASSPGQKV